MKAAGGHQAARQSHSPSPFSSKIPESCQLFQLQNVAIPVTYFANGLIQGLMLPILSSYPGDIGLSAGQEASIQGFYTLPLAFKIFMGFFTDNMTSGGYRRRPALFLGWFVAVASLVVLMIASNTQFVPGQDPPPDAPSAFLLGNSIFWYGVGVNLASTVADGMVAEKYQLEGESRGNFLTSCLLFRYSGLALAASLSPVVYSGAGSITVFALLAIVPAMLLWIIMYLDEDVKVEELPGFRKNCENLWDMIQTRAVWQSMGFIFLYNAVQVDNLAYWDFLELSLEFTNTQLNIVTIVSLFFIYLGVVTFKYGFML